MGGVNPFLLLTLGVALSVLVIPVLTRAAPRLGLLDLPDPRKVHATAVPRVGGWGIAVGGLVPLLLAFDVAPLLQSYAIGVAILFAFGVWDDARELGHWTKFAGQVLAVSVVVFYGDLYVARLPFFERDVLSASAGQWFTLFALVGVINAINHSDGLDGLAGGESLLALIAMAVLGYLVGDQLAVGIALTTSGGILGFLRYNSHPARVFMGDSGSQILGFTLGFLAIYLTQVAHGAISAALPLLLLGLPVADLLAVFYQRIRGGQNWFRATRNHLHHRLLELGFNHYETVIIIYSVQAVLVACGVSIRYETDWIVAGVYFVVVGALFGSVVFAERTGRRVRRVNGAAPIDAALSSTLRNPLLHRVPLAVISAIVSGFMLFASLWVTQVPRDFSIAAAVLACLVLAELLRPRAPRSIVLRASTYAAATFSAYLLIIYPGVDSAPARAAAIAVIATLAVAIAVYVRFSERQEFGTTPTDYLVAFGVLVLAASAFVDVGSRSIVELVAYAVVLLYGCEIAFVRAVRRWPLLHVATCASLAILALRGVL